MQNEQFKTILQYIDVVINQAETSCDADTIATALDQVHDLIRFHIAMIEEEEDYV